MKSCGETNVTLKKKKKFIEFIKFGIFETLWVNVIVTLIAERSTVEEDF